MLPAPLAKRRKSRCCATFCLYIRCGVHFPRSGNLLLRGRSSVTSGPFILAQKQPSSQGREQAQEKAASRSAFARPGPARPGLVVWPRSSRTAFLLLGPRALGSTTTTLPCSQRSSEPQKEAACPPFSLWYGGGGVRVGGGGAKTAFLFLATQASRPSLLRLRCGRVPDLTDCALVKRTPLEEDVTYRT